MDNGKTSFNWTALETNPSKNLNDGCRCNAIKKQHEIKLKHIPKQLGVALHSPRPVQDISPSVFDVCAVLSW